MSFVEMAGTSPAITTRSHSIRTNAALKRGRRDNDHVRARAVLRPRRSPAEIASEVGSGGRRLGERDAELLLVLGATARQLPRGDRGLGPVVRAGALIAGTGRRHHRRVGRDGEADGQALRNNAL